MPASASSLSLLRCPSLATALLAAFGVACAGDGTEDGAPPNDPDLAPIQAVDRFSETAGHLQVRTPENGLPAANAPVDFDQGPFVTRGLTPAGNPVSYYNFDVQPTDPGAVYTLYEAGAASPVDGQLDIVDAIPGEAGYSDFRRVVKVTVPAGYVANTHASLDDLTLAGLAMEDTDALVNAPIVPPGSVAPRRHGGGSASLVRGWYRGMVVSYFTFEETRLQMTAGMVPTSPIWVTFNVNPDQPEGGPGSGFKVEEGTMVTHNVVATVPGDAGYSPLWAVQVYDNADFDTVMDAATAAAANQLAANVATVNCPIVAME